MGFKDQSKMRIDILRTRAQEKNLKDNLLEYCTECHSARQMDMQDETLYTQRIKA